MTYPNASASQRAHLRSGGVRRQALVAWSVASAATLGTLFGLGRRHSTLLRPLNAAAHTLLGARADDVWSFQPDVTPAGVAVVLVVSAAAALAIAVLSASRSPTIVTLAVFGVALAGYFVHVHIVARTHGGLAALLTIGELRALYTSAAIAFFLGMRYAFLIAADASPT